MTEHLTTHQAEEGARNDNILIYGDGVWEAFLTGTFGAQTPVGSSNGREIRDGQLGSMTARIHALHADLITAECA